MFHFYFVLCMLSEAYQRVATRQLDSNCCSFIVIFVALSSATLKCERAFNFALPTNE